jgi:hypothetical protein
VTLTFDLLTRKTKEVTYFPRPLHLSSLRAKGLWVVSLLIGNCFYLQCQYELDLWPLDHKINRGHLLAKTNAPMQLRANSRWVVKCLTRIRFYLQGQCDLHLWPFVPKTNRGHLLANTNAHIQLKGQGPISCQFLNQKPFIYKVNMNLTFVPLIPKSKGVMYLPKPMYVCSLRVKGPWIVKLFIGNCVYLHGQFVLDLWPLNPEINTGHLLAKTNAPMQFEGQGSMGCQVIGWKPFLPTVNMTLTLDPWFQNLKGSCTCQSQFTYAVWGPKTHWLSSYSSETVLPTRSILLRSSFRPNIRTLFITPETTLIFVDSYYIYSDLLTYV